MEYEKVLYLCNDKEITESDFIVQLCNFLLYKDNNIRKNLRDLLNIVCKSIDYTFSIKDNIDQDIITIFTLNPIDDHKIEIIYNSKDKSCSLFLKSQDNTYELKELFFLDYNQYQICYEFIRNLEMIFENQIFIRKSFKYDIDQYKLSIERVSRK